MADRDDGALSQLNLLYAFVAIFAGQPVNATVLKALDPGGLGPQEYLTLLQVVIATFPLTVSLALFVGFLDLYPNVWAALTLLGVLLLGSIWFGNTLGYVEVSEQVQGGGAHWVVLALLRNYLNVYGWGYFLASLALAGYGGWQILKARGK